MRDFTEKNNKKLVFYSGIVGNLLDHYDTALYVFLAPFIAPIFFPTLDPTAGLIAMLGIKVTGLFTRPFGSVFFGHLASKYCVSNLLAITLLGVAVSTFIMGVLPSYDSIGIAAPLLLVVVRIIQGIFASGEHSLAALFFIEQTSDDKTCGKSSGYYAFTTMSGTLLASITATLVSSSSNPQFYWRIAYISAILTGIVGIYLRLILKYKKVEIKQTNVTSIKALNIHKFKIMKIVILQGFAMITYMPFIFFNNFIPLITNIQTKELLIHNNFLLIWNNILILLISFVVDKYDYTKMMFWIIFAVFITIIPIFVLLPHLNIWMITGVKLWIVTLGVMFCVPLNILIFRMVKDNHKYLINGFGYALGIELFGRNISLKCLLIWEYTHNLVATSSLLAFICFLGLIVLLHEMKINKNES